MRDIAIYGAGGFGREIACLIRRINDAAQQPQWNFIGFFDDGVPPTTDYPYGPVLGGMDKANSWDSPLDIAIAIGTPRVIETIVSKITNPNISFPNVISPDLILLDKDTCTMGRGNIICTGCLISYNTRIGDFNQFNGFITIGHDASIGNYNSFMPGVRVSGEVTIGNKNFWGFNSGILQQKTVGDNVTVGVGSIIFRKPKDGCTYMGVPASMVKY